VSIALMLSLQLFLAAIASVKILLSPVDWFTTLIIGVRSTVTSYAVGKEIGIFPISMCTKLTYLHQLE